MGKQVFYLKFCLLIQLRWKIEDQVGNFFWFGDTAKLERSGAKYYLLNTNKTSSLINIPNSKSPKT